MGIPLVVVALALSAQAVGGTNSRYSDTSGQPAPPPAGTAGSTSATITPFGTPPATTGGTAAAPPATPSTPATGGSSYTPNRPSAFGGQLGASGNSATTNSTNTNTTNTGNSGARPISGQVSPPPGFPGQSGYSTANQPPSKSALMMQAMLTPPRDSVLRGEPVRLIDVVSSGGTRNDQTQRIEAYWDLCSSVADYYLSVREQEELRNLGAGGARQSGALQEAEKKMGVRSKTSLHAARAAQYRLAGFIGRGPNSLPLPADLPHCGTYTSKYEQIFAGKSSPEAQELYQLLPLRYAELDDQAANVQSAEDWLKGVIARNENSDAVGNVRALELLALQRRAFVQIARDYNRRIARYAELATPGQVSPDRLTGMLIRRTSSTNPAARQSGGVDSPPRTFATTPITDGNLASDRPSFTDDVKVDPAVRPASDTQPDDGKRSLLVPVH